MGPDSASVKAIADAEARRQAGESVEFFRDGQTVTLECTTVAAKHQKKSWIRCLITFAGVTGVTGPTFAGTDRDGSDFGRFILSKLLM
jgi:hypothetical protein